MKRFVSLRACKRITPTITGTFRIINFYEDINPINILILIGAIAVGVYAYNSAEEENLVEECFKNALIDADCL